MTSDDLLLPGEVTVVREYDAVLRRPKDSSYELCQFAFIRNSAYSLHVLSVFLTSEVCIYNMRV